MNELNKSMVLAGNATFTVRNASKQHYTFKIRESEDHRYFASMLTGPDNTSDYQYVGVVDPTTLQVKLTKASKFKDETVPVKVLRWTLAHLQHNKPFPSGYLASHAGRCCRCGRLLTDPISIETGFGPECRNILGKGGH